MQKGQMNSKTINLLVIGDGPLFNHCLSYLQKKGINPYIITPLKNANKLKKKKRIIKYNELFKLNKINILLSIMNGKIIEKEILKKTKIAINFHDAPLPKYGGLYSSSWAIINNEKNHGCCWHEMNTEIDKGNILSFKNFKIEDEDTSYSVDLKSLFHGFNLFVNDIFKLIKKKKIIIKKKNKKLISYYGKKHFKKFPNLGFLDFKKSYNYNLNIFRATSTSKEKKNFIFQPKILTKQGILTVKNFKVIKCDKNDHTKKLKNSLNIKFKKYCYQIDLINKKIKNVQIVKNKINSNNYLYLI
jgi:methionyl-tRNA formyltransferase